MSTWAEALKNSWQAAESRLGRPPRTAILGIGQPLRGDDAAGLEVARRLLQILSFDQQSRPVEADRPLVLEAGPVPENFTGTLRRFSPDWILLVDAAQMDSEPGDIYWLELNTLIGVSAATHSLPLHVLADYLKAELGCQVGLIGIQPQGNAVGAPLSPAVLQAVDRVVEELVKTLNIPPAPETIHLRDGTPVIIRPIRPDDAARLQALLTRLSPQSIYFRFLEFLKTLDAEKARGLATVDYRQRMAFVATLDVQGEEQIIAVARYSVISPDKTDLAEVGVVVEDLYQGLGLGSYLLKRLTGYACEQGIRKFVGTINHQNRRILSFIKNTGLPTERYLEQGTWEISIDLQPCNSPGEPE